MKVVITQEQKNKLEKIIQRIIDSELDNIRKESEEWGLGEMDELHEIERFHKVFNGFGTFNFCIRSLCDVQSNPP